MFGLFKKEKNTLGPSVPEGVRVYAIGDIHGCLRELERLVAKIEDDIRLSPEAEIIEVYLGDYVDRGPESCSVIEWLITAPLLGKERICLKGNHEVFLEGFLNDPHTLESWQQAGGREALLSYGIEQQFRGGATASDVHRSFVEALPERHREFFKSLKLSHIIGDYFFVHAGVRPGIALEAQKETDMLWIRGDFLLSRYDFGKIIVHGHTPCSNPEVLPNRINIDTGAFLTQKLTCLVLEKNDHRFIHSI